MSPTQQNKLTVLVKRFLDLLRFLFVGVAVIWPLMVLIVGLGISSDPEQRHTDVSAFLSFRINPEVISERVNPAAGENDVIMSGRGVLKLNNTQSRLGWYLTGAITEILLFVFLYGLLIMRKLFASLVKGTTFSQQNVARIRKIGYLLIAWQIISPVLQYLGSRILLEDVAFNVPGIQLFPAFEFNIGGVFVGLAIIVLSGVMSEAADIHKDQSLTI